MCAREREELVAQVGEKRSERERKREGERRKRREERAIGLPVMRASETAI